MASIWLADDVDNPDVRLLPGKNIPWPPAASPSICIPTAPWRARRRTRPTVRRCTTPNETWHRTTSRVLLLWGSAGYAGSSQQGAYRGTVKRCAIKEFVGPRSLPHANALQTPGEGRTETWIHHAVCPVCKLEGHRVMTKMYATTRWMTSTTTALGHKRRQTELKFDDFPCRLVSPEAHGAFLESVRSEAWAAPQDRRTSEDAVAGIVSKSFQSQLTLLAPVDQVATNGTRPASVHPAYSPLRVVD